MGISVRKTRPFRDCAALKVIATPARCNDTRNRHTAVRHVLSSNDHERQKKNATRVRFACGPVFISGVDHRNMFCIYHLKVRSLILMHPYPQSTRKQNTVERPRARAEETSQPWLSWRRTVMQLWRSSLEQEVETDRLSYSPRRFYQVIKAGYRWRRQSEINKLFLVRIFSSALNFYRT